MTNQTTFASRLNAARKAVKVSQTSLAKGIGVSQNTVSDWEHGRYEPTLDTIARIARHLEIDPAILTGNSPMPHTLATTGTAAVPEYDISVAAGAGAVITDAPPVAHWPFPTKLFDEMGRAPEPFVLLTVVGDSMEPTLKSGDRILVDTSRSTPSAPGIYVIATDDFAAVKRLEMIPGAKPARVRIRSDNPLHGAFEASLRDVRVIGWVAAVLTIF
jgi:phage repressor protein C with HTH and peptisase S24 domain